MARLNYQEHRQPPRRPVVYLELLIDSKPIDF